MQWKIQPAPTNRPPARCINRHVHQFEPDGISFTIYGQDAAGRRFTKLRVKLEPPHTVADVKHCAACGCSLITIEAGSQI